MKFVAAMIVTTLLAGAIGAGLLAMAHGHGPWLFLITTAGFLGLFVHYGCKAH
ncbi:MAG: hypothetical protein IT580_10375 [Verrucomicrobiales bacterium]|nr:hypothetical protein [Verrucomicrobiales bacterium]